MREKVWRTIFMIGIVFIIIWGSLLITNIIEITKLRAEILKLNSDSLSDNSTNENTEKDWCYMQTSWDGTKYCDDIQGWHFDFCNGQDYYTWHCSTKEDVEEKRTLHENICLSIINVCPEGYTCKSSDSPKSVSCQKS